MKLNINSSTWSGLDSLLGQQSGTGQRPSTVGHSRQAEVVGVLSLSYSLHGSGGHSPQRFSLGVNMASNRLYFLFLGPHQIVAAPVHCSKFVVPITPRSARVLVGTQTGECLTVEGVHTKLRLFSLLRTEGDELFVLSQLEQSKNYKKK